MFDGTGLSIRNNSLRSWYAEGAGLYSKLYVDAGSLNLSRSVISDNVATADEEAHGAGVYLATPSVIFGDVTVRDNSIRFTPTYTYVTGNGAGIYATTVCMRGSLTGVVVEGNWLNATQGGMDSVSARGGGIMWDGDWTHSTLEMARCVIRDNRIDIVTTIPDGYVRVCQRCILLGDLALLFEASRLLWRVSSSSQVYIAHTRVSLA